MFTVALLCGCVFADKYPAAWPGAARVNDGECADLSGSYKDRGKSSRTDSGISFCHLLNGVPMRASEYPGYVPARRAEWFAIRRPDDKTVELVCYDQSGDELFSKRWSGDKGEYTCDSEGLAVRKPVELLNANVVSALRWGTHRYTKANDGSLIVKAETADIVGPVVIPLGYVSEVVWIIYQALP